MPEADDPLEPMGAAMAAERSRYDIVRAPDGIVRAPDGIVRAPDGSDRGNGSRPPYDAVPMFRIMTPQTPYARLSM